MRVASKLMIDDVGSMNVLLNDMGNELNKRGNVVRNKTIQVSDSHASNFTQNTLTVLLTANIYKAPRIVTKQKHKRGFDKLLKYISHA